MSILHDLRAKLEGTLNACNEAINQETTAKVKAAVDPVNADGDSIADMRAVQDVSRCRITAKHSDTYDPSRMDWTTWFDAASNRGLIPMLRDGIWTAITREQYERERTATAWERGESRWTVCGEGLWQWRRNDSGMYVGSKLKGKYAKPEWDDTGTNMAECLARGEYKHHEIPFSEAERIMAGWAQPEEVEDGVDVWKARAEALWQLLDDIDTLDDACRGNDELFRNCTRRAQQKRMRYAESPDGHVLDWKDVP